MRCRMKLRLTAAAVGLTALAAAVAQAATPIPEGPDAGSAPTFIGSPATPHPISTALPPTHPFMAANGRSNIHVDAYQTDANSWAGPLGKTMQRVSTFLSSDCASVTFDTAGRIVTICVGLSGPKLYMLDPKTLDTLATFDLPPRQPGASNPFSDFSSGGYFYLDNQDRAVIPTTTRHIWVVSETSGAPGF